MARKDWTEAIASAARRQSEEAAPLEAVFKEWEEEQAADPALRKLMEETRPLRERLLNPSAGEGERFADLHRLEEILAARQGELEARSPEAGAAAAAAALEPVEGMSALAAALRAKDFEKAGQRAGEAGAKLASAASAPAGAKAASLALLHDVAHHAHDIVVETILVPTSS